MSERSERISKQRKAPGEAGAHRRPSGGTVTDHRLLEGRR